MLEVGRERVGKVTDLQLEPPEHDSSRAAHSLRLNFPVA
jgi:hypothetical protein